MTLQWLCFPLFAFLGRWEGGPRMDDLVFLSEWRFLRAVNVAMFLGGQRYLLSSASQSGFPAKSTEPSWFYQTQLCPLGAYELLELFPQSQLTQTQNNMASVPEVSEKICVAEKGESLFSQEIIVRESCQCMQDCNSLIHQMPASFNAVLDVSVDKLEGEPELRLLTFSWGRHIILPLPGTVVKRVGNAIRLPKLKSILYHSLAKWPRTSSWIISKLIWVIHERQKNKSLLYKVDMKVKCKTLAECLLGI